MKRFLYAQSGRAIVRETRDAVDAATWTPDNLSAGETSGGVVADDVIFDGEGWENVRIVAQFAGTPGGTELVTIQPLRALWKSAAPGRDWIPVGDPIALTAPADDTSGLVLVDGGKLAFRITALTLGAASSVGLIVTGGQRARRTS